MDSAREDRPGLRKRRQERPEVPAGAGTRPGQGPTQPAGAIVQWSCRRTRPFPPCGCSDPPLRGCLLRPHLLCVLLRQAKFICQIRDTTLAIRAFLLPFPNPSGRALLKGKSCVLTGQGPQPRSQQTAPTVALPSVSVVQPPYPNGEAVSLDVGVWAQGTLATGWHGGWSPRSQGAERAVSLQSI